MMAYGRLLRKQGRLDEAEPLLRRCVERGNMHAENDLALVLRERRRHVEAENHFREAIANGDVHAMGNLAAMLEDLGRTREAEAMWERAADARSVENVYARADRHWRDGDFERALDIYRAGMRAGDDRARFTLARMLRQRGATDEAEEIYADAIRNGKLEAMNVIALMLQHRGEKEEAEYLFRRAIDAGHEGAKVNLARLQGLLD